MSTASRFTPYPRAESTAKMRYESLSAWFGEKQALKGVGMGVDHNRVDAEV